MTHITSEASKKLVANRYKKGLGQLASVLMFPVNKSFQRIEKGLEIGVGMIPTTMAQAMKARDIIAVREMLKATDHLAMAAEATKFCSALASLQNILEETSKVGFEVPKEVSDKDRRSGESC